MKKTIFLGLTAITLALTSSAARAGDVRFSFNFGLPVPRVYVPAPLPPPPIYVAPPVVYVQPGYCHPGFVTYRGYIRCAPRYHHYHGHRSYSHY